MTAKSYLSYPNKLIHHSIGKKTINAYHSILTEKSETNPKTPKFKIKDKDKVKW